MKNHYIKHDLKSEGTILWYVHVICMSDNTILLSASKTNMWNKEPLRRSCEGRYTKESSPTKEWTQMQEELLWEKREKFRRLC
jgi:hypothetical protein